MSFAGHVLCQRMVMGPVWPLAITGNPSVAAVPAAPAAALRNLRRVELACAVTAECAEHVCGLRAMAPPRVGQSATVGTLLIPPRPSTLSRSVTLPRSRRHYTDAVLCVQRRRQ